MEPSQRKKLGDVLCDLGKYMLTVVPFSYFISDKPDTLYIVISIVVFGLLLILFGLYFIKQPEEKTTGTSKKRNIKLLKNTVFVVEEKSAS